MLTAAIVIAIILVNLVIYAQVLGFQFIRSYDDAGYVIHNPYLKKGFSIEGLRWAFTSTYCANWHPITWLSHMLDYRIFRLNPAGHHAVNLLIHIATSILLFWVLKKMTQTIGKSAFVALLFAVHPLHVESVAWVAERKDVLSGFFWTLTILAYARYAEKSGILRYLLVFASMALGLMSKPMVVTLPLVLLLLDFWPLGRLSTVPLSKLFWEKIPLFVLSLGSSVMTIVAQHKGMAVTTLAQRSVSVRIQNAIVSYVRYILKTFWPAQLAAFYPTEVWSITVVASSAMFILVLSLLAVSKRRTHPYIAVGWFWYIITLIPVIGLVQVGSQAMADRYTYIPLTGIFIIIAWGFPSLFAKRFETRPSTNPTQMPRQTTLLIIAAALVIVVLAWRTYNQASYWRDGYTLWNHAIEVTSDNWMAYGCLSCLCAEDKKLEEAITNGLKALNLSPDFLLPLLAVGTSLVDTGRYAEAVPYLEKALARKHAPETKLEIFHNALGLAYAGQGKFPKALTHYKEAIRIAPNWAEPRNNMAAALGQLGRYREAAEMAREAIRIAPRSWRAHANFVSALVALKQYSKAWNHVQVCTENNIKLPESLIETVRRHNPAATSPAQ